MKLYRGYMSTFELIPDHELQPATPEAPSKAQKMSLYVLMTPYLNSGDILTLPGGEILKGDRNITKSIEGNAFQIVNNKLHGFAPKSGRWIMNKESNPYGMAYLAQRVHEKRNDMQGIADYTDLDPAKPIPKHELPLERHTYRSYIARLAIMNASANTPDGEKPPRAAEKAFLDAYKDLIIA